MKTLSVVLLLCFLLCVIRPVKPACVAPPSDMRVCPLPSTARVPQEYSNTNADRQLQAYFNFLDNIKAVPTKKCAEAYIQFACSNAYPRCNGDANSGLSYAVNTCFDACESFVRECEGQLLGLERPSCGKYSVTSDCTYHQINVVHPALETA